MGTTNTYPCKKLIRATGAEEELIAAVLAHFDMTRGWINALFKPCVRYVVRAMRLVGREVTIKSVIGHMTPDALSELVEELRTEEDSFAAHLECYLQGLRERERRLLFMAEQLADPPGRDDADLLKALLAQFRLDGKWERELYGHHLSLVLSALRLTGGEPTIANAIANIPPVSLLALAQGIDVEPEKEKLIGHVGSLTTAERGCLENPGELHVNTLQEA